MASRLRDALSRATPFPLSSSHHPKAAVAETAASPTNISSDSAFAGAYSKLDEAGVTASSTDGDTTTPQTQQPSTTPPRRRSSTPSASSDPKALHNQYKLRVTAGPSYDPSTHTLVHVNTPHTVLVSNEHLTARVAVRIRDFSGLPSTSPATTPYFSSPQHARDRYSISFSFVPRRDIAAADTVWGPDCARPVRDRLPPGFGYAVGIVKRFVDPSIEVDAYADEPWVYAPALSCWYALRVGAMLGAGEGVAVPPPQRAEEVDEELVRSEGAGVLEEGADGDGVQVREAWGCPADPLKRRKYFYDRKKREEVVFEKGRLYQTDFFNPYIDFDKFALRLPGFSLGVLKYIDDKTHTLRWVFKNRVTNEVYLVVIFHLLYGEELEEALRAEEAENDDLD
ncbi:hypothetical protein GTA08_BOTSDO11373 [Neofusicoccum parvum]|nr:hypothetical protein GTA08_BOTSDO11373 [Neofusicoccum parvum]